MDPTHLSNKSEINLKSAQLLIDNSLFASSVHCSYYGMFQYMICKLREHSKLSFETLSKDSKGSSSHEYIITETIKCIRGLIITPEIHVIKKNVIETNIYKLRRKINDLKNFRIQSDYRNMEIESVKSNQSLEISKEIIREINSYMP